MSLLTSSNNHKQADFLIFYNFGIAGWNVVGCQEKGLP